MIQMGDMFTIEGVHNVMRNPNRRWWQLWKPRMVPDHRRDGLRQFKVISVSTSRATVSPPIIAKLRDKR